MYPVLSQYTTSAQSFLSMCLDLAVSYLVDVLFFLQEVVNNIMAQELQMKISFQAKSGVFTLLFCFIHMPFPLIKSN